MATKKISELPVVTTPGATDEVIVNQSSATSRMTMANLMGYGNGGQPPAPKPNLATNTNPGYVTNVIATAGNTVTNPGTSGERYLADAMVFDTTSGVLNTSFSGYTPNVTGGATLLTVPAGHSAIVGYTRTL